MSTSLEQTFGDRFDNVTESIATGEFTPVDSFIALRQGAGACGLSASPIAATLSRHVEPNAVIHGGDVNDALPARARRAVEQIVARSTLAAARVGFASSVVVPAEIFAAKLAEHGRLAPGAGSATVSGMSTAATSKVNASAKNAMSELVHTLRMQAASMKPLAKFFTHNANIHVGGPTEADPKPVFSTVKRLATVGLVASVAFTLLPSQQADAANQHAGAAARPAVAFTRAPAAVITPRPVVVRSAPVYQSQWQNNNNGAATAAAVVTGVAVGAAVATQTPYAAAIRNNGYYPTTNYPQQQISPPTYGNNGYGNGYGAGNGYGNGPVQMSHQMALAIKAVVAVNTGSTGRADSIVNRAEQIGLNCVRRFGPDARCIQKVGGATMDFGRGMFQAESRGVVIATEANGRFRENVDASRYVWSQAKAINAREQGVGANNGYGGANGGYNANGGYDANGGGGYGGYGR